mmetsp:Transcript_40074/g.100274  ORF Transcript_40074/g.100274 Transcript_40074/m.100274 type:complete len:193 (-) Transcript_40074:3149-3727(-)
MYVMGQSIAALHCMYDGVMMHWQGGTRGQTDAELLDAHTARCCNPLQACYSHKCFVQTAQTYSDGNRVCCARASMCRPGDRREEALVRGGVLLLPFQMLHVGDRQVDTTARLDALTTQPENDTLSEDTGNRVRHSPMPLLHFWSLSVALSGNLIRERDEAASNAPLTNSPPHKGQEERATLCDKKTDPRVSG